MQAADAALRSSPPASHFAPDVQNKNLSFLTLTLSKAQFYLVRQLSMLPAERTLG